MSSSLSSRVSFSVHVCMRVFFSPYVYVCVCVVWELHGVIVLFFSTEPNNTHKHTHVHTQTQEPSLMRTPGLCVCLPMKECFRMSEGPIDSESGTRALRGVQAKTNTVFTNVAFIAH